MFPAQGQAAKRVARYRLSPLEARQACELGRSCHAAYGRVDDPRFLQEVTVIAHDLPRPLRLAINCARLDDRLHAFKIEGNETIDGELGPTPRHWRDADTPGSRDHAFLLMIYAACLGDVIGWATQQSGRMVTDVVPMPGFEQSLISSSSHKELGWHTEDAFTPHRADYVGLMCLRNPDQVPTIVAYPDLEALPPEAVELLRQPRYHIFADASHDGAVHRDGQRPPELAGDAAPEGRPTVVPLLTGSADAPSLRTDRDYVVPASGDLEAARALQMLIEHLDGTAYDLALSPGDVCFLDNRNVAHGRRAFQPRYDGRDRWLKRVNVVADLRRTRPVRASAEVRVIAETVNPLRPAHPAAERLCPRGDTDHRSRKA